MKKFAGETSYLSRNQMSNMNRVRFFPFSFVLLSLVFFKLFDTCVSTTAFPPICSVTKHNETLIAFDDNTRWIVPGVLGDQPIATEKCCYELNINTNEFDAVPLNLTGFQRIPYYSQFYSTALFVYGYFDDDLTKLYMINLTTCNVQFGFISIPIEDFHVGEGERILALVDDPRLSDQDGLIPDFLVTNLKIYTQLRGSYLQFPLPPSISFTWDLITGVFVLGQSQSEIDYIYIGRGQSNNLSDMGDIVVLETEDSYNNIKHLRTLPIIASPLNFLGPPSSIFLGEPDCVFTTHQLTANTTFHISNYCETGYHNITNTAYQAAVVSNLTVWQTPNITVLLTTGVPPNQPGPVVEVFLYQPKLGLKGQKNIENVIPPDFVIVPQNGLDDQQVLLFTHFETGEAIYQVVDLSDSMRDSNDVVDLWTGDEWWDESQGGVQSLDSDSGSGYSCDENGLCQSLQGSCCLGTCQVCNCTAGPGFGCQPSSATSVSGYPCYLCLALD